MSAAPTLANLTDGESAARRAALRLHALTPFDRAWLLARLTPAERVRVEPLRAELVALRIPAATAQVADSPAGVGADFTAPKRSGEPGRQASHHGVGPAANGDFGRPAHGGGGAAGSATGRTAASAGLDGAADVDALAGVASVDAVAGVDGTDRGCDAARALRVLVTLPPGLATAILAAAPWSWRDALLARLDPGVRQGWQSQVRRGLPPALRAALIAAFEAEVRALPAPRPRIAWRDWPRRSGAWLRSWHGRFLTPSRRESAHG